MEQEISKVWILEQFNKIHESLKKDLERVDKKLESYVTHQICDERRHGDLGERERTEKRLDSIDDDLDTVKTSFDTSVNQIRMWVWGIFGAIIGELIIIVMNMYLTAK